MAEEAEVEDIAVVEDTVVAEDTVAVVEEVLAEEASEEEVLEAVVAEAVLNVRQGQPHDLQVPVAVVRHIPVDLEVAVSEAEVEALGADASEAGEVEEVSK